MKKFLKTFDPLALVSAKKQDKKVGVPKEVARETEQSTVVADANSEENPQH